MKIVNIRLIAFVLCAGCAMQPAEGDETAQSGSQAISSSDLGNEAKDPAREPQTISAAAKWRQPCSDEVSCVNPEPLPWPVPWFNAAASQPGEAPVSSEKNLGGSSPGGGQTGGSGSSR